MSSDRTGLTNLDYVPRYREVLERNLPAEFTRFGEFFAGTQRLQTLGAMLARHFDGAGREVLNVGSGPFASEIFLAQLQKAQVTSFDYEARFAPFHQIFRAEGHLANTSFAQADAMSIEYAPDRFDLVIVHDVFYENALNIEALVPRLARFIRPGGLIFFDFVNARTAWLWKALGKNDSFRRYDPDAVRRFLTDTGFDIVEFRHTHGSASPVISAAHWLLWTGARISNNYAVLARKRG